MCKLGDFELNQIYTGDARTLAKGIPDESVHLVLTDPPFGIGFHYDNGFQDTADLKEYLEFTKWIVQESDRVIVPGGLCFVFQASKLLQHTFSVFPFGSRIFAACKNFVQMRPTPVQFAFDPVIFWQKEGQYSKDAYGRDFHVGNTANTNNRALNEVGFHSCPRPLDTITYMIDCFCPEGGIVLDWFMGSGTTAVAAKITGRQWLGFEIIPETASLANERVESAPLPLSLSRNPHNHGMKPTPYQPALEGILE